MQHGIPSAKSFDAVVDEIIYSNGCDVEQLLPILKTLQAQSLPFETHVLDQIASRLKIPPSQVKGVASFYSMLDESSVQEDRTIRVCDGVVCWLKGRHLKSTTIEEFIEDIGDCHLTRTSCIGQCDRAPVALFGVTPAGPLSDPQVFSSIRHGAQAPSTSPVQLIAHPFEHRILLKRVGDIDPDSIDDAIQAGVYSGLKQALQHDPQYVINEIEKSGLSGRGGAGFPTGRKWKLVADSIQTERYVVCNADESEPLMFKDRVLLESDPHSVIEGILLAGYAVGAQDGFIYIRGEYEQQALIMERAIQQAREKNLLGEHIAGSDFSFELKVHRGAGAYICGEETALLESLEGRRGEPRLRPPYPAQAGYLGAPTIVNNVETLATASAILRMGAEQYYQVGNSSQPGTRLFTLLGDVHQTGLFELPFGLTLREVIDDIGGGMQDASEFQFALIGGAAGMMVSLKHLDRPFGDHAVKKELSPGSGGILICDASVSPVAVLRELMFFFEKESCGKCTPCRVGTHEVRQTLDNLLQGTGTSDDIRHLRHLARTLKTSFCGLGTSAADPLVSCLDNFPEHFEELVIS